MRRRIMWAIGILVALVLLAALGLWIAVQRNGPAVLDTVDRIAGGSSGVELVQIFEGRILAVTQEELTVSLEGHPTKVDDFEEMLRPFGIREIQRTGRVALPRLDRDRALDAP